MLNIAWLIMILVSVVAAIFNHRLDALSNGITESATTAFSMALGLGGILCFWLGLFKIAEQAKLVNILSRLIKPLMKRLFPDVPAEHPAMGAIILNISANMLGLNNAATPFGLQAMSELQKLNPYPKIASNSMCTFLAINTSSVQLIPTTAIAYLTAAHADNPTSIIFSAFIATTCSTVTAIIVVKWLQRLKAFRISGEATL